MVGRLTLRGAEAKADQRTLRSLLERSDYATCDLEPQEERDRAREHRIFDQINDGMIMPTDDPASKRQRVLADRAALSRWEDEGGSSSPSGHSENPVPEGSDDGEGR